MEARIDGLGIPAANEDKGAETRRPRAKISSAPAVKYVYRPSVYVYCA